MNLPEYKFSFEDFQTFVMSEECYKDYTVFWIDYMHLVHKVEASSFIQYQAVVIDKLSNGYTVKIERFENMLGFTDGTVHVFYNSAGSPSFKEHTDPVDVIIEVKDGVKNLVIDGWPVSLLAGDHYVIQKDVPHYATNEHEGLIFSYGLHDNAEY